MERSEIKIKYRTGIMHSGSLDGNVYKEYSYDYVSASVKSVKRYRGALMLLMGISGCELHLIEWLAENMSEENLVHNNLLTRQAFIAFYDKHKRPGNKVYSDHSVQKAFQRLTAENLLTIAARGVFRVNPMYYFSRSDEERVKSIRMMMDFESGQQTRITIEVKK